MLAVSVIALYLVAFALAQVDALKDFCRRWGHQTAVVDNRLYLDGGWVNWKPFTEDSVESPSESLSWGGG